jgi:hypothetical protein
LKIDYWDPEDKSEGKVLMYWSEVFWYLYDSLDEREIIWQQIIKEERERLLKEVQMNKNKTLANPIR